MFLGSNMKLFTMRTELHDCRDQGPVVQNIVSLTSSLRGQLVKCFTALLPNTPNFFVEKMKLLTLFQQKILAYFRY